ncbi:unnamed protein product [Closterium sp. NIES-65]|nr:unnamed protein product [Closterium sp. NIES-65]
MHFPASPWLRALAGLSAALALACLYAAVSAPSASLLSAFVSAGGYGGGSGGEDAGNEREAELGARPFDDAEWGEGETGQEGLGGQDLFALAAEAGREGEAGRGREAGLGKGEEDATLYPSLDGRWAVGGTACQRVHIRDGVRTPVWSCLPCCCLHYAPPPNPPHSRPIPPSHAGESALSHPRVNGRWSGVNVAFVLLRHVPSRSPLPLPPHPHCPTPSSLPLQAPTTRAPYLIPFLPSPHPFPTLPPFPPIASRVPRSPSSPVLALLAAHRRRMQQRVEEARVHAERDEQRLHAAVRAAVRQLHVDRTSLADTFPLLDEAAASTIAALPAGDDSLAQIHAMLAAAPRVSVGEVDVEGGVEGEGTVGAAASTGVEGRVEGAVGGAAVGGPVRGTVGEAAWEEAVEEAVGECMDLYFVAEGLHTRFHIGAWPGGRPFSDTEAAAGGQGGGGETATQKQQQADREAELRQFMLGQLRALDDRRDWWVALNLTGDEASEKLNTMPDGAEKAKLSEFLFWYLPFHAWFDSEGPDHPKAVAHVEEQRAVLAAATSAAKSAESTLKATQEQLWEECGLRLPHSNWTEEQSALLERYAAVANVSGCTEQCTDWEAIYPEYETQPGLVAPKHVWQKLPEHYPDTRPNVSFIVTYGGRAERVQALVSRLYTCTHGMAGTGSLPGIRAEMVVSVMNPDVSLEAWMQARNDTAEGIFVVPVLPRLGAAPLMFNDLARMARGELLMLLDGDTLPPASCVWLDRVLAAFAAWPRLAVAGFRTDALGEAGRAQERVEGEEAPQGARAAASVRFWTGLAEEMEGRGGEEGGEVGWRDPETGVAMHFTGLVTAFPLVLRRSVLEDMGWLDEADLRQGAAAVMSDWHLCCRAWLSGYQVARLQLPTEEGDHGDWPTVTRAQHRHVLPGRGVSGGGEQGSAVEYGEYDAAMAGYHDDIVKEVARLNHLLVRND